MQTVENLKVSREQYFVEMQETWNLTQKFMLLKIEKSLETNVALKALLFSNPVVKKRLTHKKPMLRPFLVRLSYEACRGNNWKSLIPVFACAEFLNISTYITNAVFDEKAERTKNKDINQYIILSMIFRDLANESLSDLKASLSQEELQIIHNKINEINRLIYFGQYLDLYELKYDKINKEKLNEFKKLYLERCEKFTGVFFANLSYIGALLADGTFAQKKALERFGFSLGTGDQIVNDLGDFVIESAKATDFEKSYKDLYSDLKQGKTTYPVLLSLELGKNLVSSNLNNKNLSIANMRGIANFFVSSDIFSKTKKLSISKFHECKKELKKLPESRARNMLSIMASLLRSNKYFAFFRELKKNQL